MLTVPAPLLDFQATSNGKAFLEKLIQIRCPAVKFSDGTAFTLSNLGQAGFFIYRQQAGSGADIWHDVSKQWVPDPGVPPPTLKPQLFAFAQDDPFPWQGMLIAVGQKDKDNADQFQKAAANFPYYYIRAYFASTENGSPVAALGGPSTPLHFVSMTDAQRVGVRLKGKPEDATGMALFLRSPAPVEIGSIELTSANPYTQVDIIQRDAAGNPGASLSLLPNGDIELRPAPGRNIVLADPVVTERVYYQPAGINGVAVGPKKWLI